LRFRHIIVVPAPFYRFGGVRYGLKEAKLQRYFKGQFTPAEIAHLEKKGYHKGEYIADHSDIFDKHVKDHLKDY
jgi:hypothetical protein